MMVPKRLPVIVALILTFALLMSGCNHVEAAKPAPTPSSSNQSSVLTEINGTVEVLQAGSTNWTQAMDGMRLKAGDRIRTGGNSSVLLLLFEGSTMELQPNTEVSIEELNRAPDTGSTAIGLKQTIGNTLNRVEKLVDSQSRYEVETPSASAVVRGTGYWVQVLPDGTTTIRVSSGSVWIMAQGVVVVVNAGEESTIRPGSPPGTPVPISTPAPSPTSAASPSSQPTPTPNITPSPYVTLEASPTPAAPPPDIYYFPHTYCLTHRRGC